MIVTPMPIIIPMHNDGNNGDMPTRFIIFIIICLLVMGLFTIDGLFGFKVTQSLGMLN